MSVIAYPRVRADFAFRGLEGGHNFFLRNSVFQTSVDLWYCCCWLSGGGGSGRRAEQCDNRSLGHRS